MRSRRANPNLIKRKRAYSIEELAVRLGVHKNSVRNWQRKGLKPIDSNRPLLFQGSDIREFLHRRNAARKRPCPPGTMYCLSCREPRSPALGMVDFVPFTPTSGNLKGLCPDCSTVMFRRARASSLGTVMPEYAIQITEP